MAFADQKVPPTSKHLREPKAVRRTGGLTCNAGFRLLTYTVVVKLMYTRRLLRLKIHDT